MLLPNAASRQMKAYMAPTLEEFRDWLFKVEEAFKEFLTHRELVLSLFWDKLKNVRLTGANMAVLFYHLRSMNLANMRMTQLDYLMQGNGGLNGMRLRSNALLKMFKTNEYVF